MKVFLMHPDRDFNADTPLPVNAGELADDLELSTLFEAMSRGDQYLLGVAQVALLTGLDDPAAIGFRQSVLTDCLASPDVVIEIYNVAVEAILAERKAFGGWLIPSSPDSILRRAVEVLTGFAARLRQLRRIADEHAAAFTSPGFTRLFQMLVTELDDAYFAEIDEHLRRLRFRDGVLISARLGTGNRGTGYTLRRPAAKRRRLPELPIGTRSSYAITIADRDDSGARALAELEHRGVNLVANALARSTDHILGFFRALRAELAFYIGCLNLHQRLTERGVPTCLPQALPGGAPFAFTATGLTEVCLALTTPGPVVGNDVAADDRPLVVITGANQGGKSTFLRSAGIAQLMLRAGAFVAARSLRASVAAGVFTHFKRGEDVTMISGKFAEELIRMSEIADSIAPGCLLLCNESFSATNEREGSQIAQQVVTAMLDCGVTVFFVTHQFDLASGLATQRGQQALFLRAAREADGRRTFRLAEGEPLPTSFGADIYQRVFGAAPPGEPAT